MVSWGRSWSENQQSMVSISSQPRSCRPYTRRCGWHVGGAYCYRQLALSARDSSFATEAFEAYKKKTGGLYDEATKLLTVTEKQYENLKNLAAWTEHPRRRQKDKIYLIVQDLGTQIGAGMDFINGFSWLQRFYTVYDAESMQFGSGTTASTSAET
ncbi:hypothetical protein DEU56DRAFT_778066, partial [Suillus clintonianus]|uniref:uncharacterized protein n=1 Tax=Suillus clintonianus TaxID=1904413 RepID=UPI001B85DDAA